MSEELKRLLDNTVANNGCLEWIPTKHSKGYGSIKLQDGKTYQVHRVVYTLLVGEIPPGMFICHHCDNPCCINPIHLFLGTPKDNVQDMIQKGRGKKRNPLPIIRHVRKPLKSKLERGDTTG